MTFKKNNIIFCVRISTFCQIKIKIRVRWNDQCKNDLMLIMFLMMGKITSIFSPYNVLFQADSALMFDSVYVFAKGLSAMDSGHSIKPTRLSCEIEKPWDDGLSLYNYINAVVSKDIFNNRFNRYGFFQSSDIVE